LIVYELSTVLTMSANQRALVLIVAQALSAAPLTTAELIAIEVEISHIDHHR